MYTLQDYLDKVAQRYKAGISTEHSYRGDLQNLLESLLPNVLVTNEPARIQCGAPDYILTKATIPIGYIEAKDIGKALDSKDYKEQFDRYRYALDNLIITDYLEFRFLRDGLLVTTIKLADISGNALIPKPENFAPFTDLITDFAGYKGQTITSSSKLAKMMAGKAKLLATVIEKALTSDEQSEADSTLKEQMEAFKSILIHEIEPKQFADIYAQTIAYGMFAARLHDETLDTFTRQEAAQLIPQSNPFLRKLFQYIAGYDLDDRIVWIVDSLADIFRATDVRALLTHFGKATRQTDPIIHFYETFLAEYDPKLRKSRGVWYTPEPVVDFIVRAVDDILKTDFNLPLGLADNSKTTIQVEMPVIKGKGKTKYTQLQKVDKDVHKVQILDPATGTGTFLAATIKHIHQKFKGQQGLWSQYVEDHLIPRINGFEILMASYAMAHLKLDLLLKETGYQPAKQPRLNIYLTNSLEESHPDTGTLFASWLAKESNEANHIKRDTPVMVVMGNPPYSVSSSNKGEWIQNLLADYKKDLNEKNIQPLSDDYIKFIRYGQHYIEKNGEGILAYISNNSFIDGLIHRQMRKHLLETFDKIYILDLHGNNKKKETALDGGKDENVFDIMQGVSINIFVKTLGGTTIKLTHGQDCGGDFSRPVSKQPTAQSATKAAPTSAIILSNPQLYQLDLYGLRKDKYQTLLDNSISSLAWNKIDCRAPEYSFVAKDFDVLEQYEQGFSVCALFPVNSNGIQTHRDDFVIDMDKATLINRIECFYDQNYSDAEIASKLSLKDNRDWKISEARQKETFKSSKIADVLYRPFDFRKIYYSSNLIDYGREKVMQHFLKGENIGLCFNRQIEQKRLFTDVFVTSELFSKHTLSLKESNNIAPLYIYPENTTQQLLETPVRTPNLNPEILQQIAEKLGLTFIPEVGAIPCGRPLYRNEPGQSGQPQGIVPTIRELGQPQGIVPTADENVGVPLVGALAFAPIDLLDYIYAVLHSPNYRETYKEFLKIDFPRVPFPEPQTFWSLVKLGGELRQIHLLGGPVVNHAITTYPNDGDNIVTRKINKNDFELADCRGEFIRPEQIQGRVWINDQQYFDGVPVVAWEFYIGGYQPAQKWLKDRHGRKLNFEDILHYQKVIVALTETHRIMQTIDSLWHPAD